MSEYKTEKIQKCVMAFAQAIHDSGGGLSIEFLDMKVSEFIETIAAPNGISFTFTCEK